jgi:2'-5' RNA ligase
MSEQFGLFAPAAAPSRDVPRPRRTSSARSHALFLAILPGAEDAAEILARAAAEDARLGIGGEPMDAGRLHVSLFGLVDYTDRYPVEAVERWVNALDTVRVAPFDVGFDTVATFGGQSHPLVLRSRDATPVAGVRLLREAIGRALADSGERLKWTSDEPHMTVSYRGRRIGDTPVAPVAWAAREFALIDSHVGAHIHETLERWTLRA